MGILVKATRTAVRILVKATRKAMRTLVKARLKLASSGTGVPPPTAGSTCDAGKPVRILD